MIVRYETKDERRKARLGFYTDDVFVIAHDAIREYECSLAIEELFASADKFTNYLLVNEITDKTAIDFEVDDFDAALDEDDTLFLLLSISFVKLCALRKTKPLAVDVAKALLPKCQEYEDFNRLLRAMDDKENAKHLDGWRADLIGYELKSINADGCNLQQAREVIEAIVENAEHYSTTTIEHLMNPLRDTNDQYGHAFDDVVNRLKEKLGVKTTTLLNQTLNYNAPIGQQIAYAGKVERGHDGEQ